MRASRTHDLGIQRAQLKRFSKMFLSEMTSGRVRQDVCVGDVDMDVCVAR
jgi:hypothetical protein